jgi:hypothetical protein
LVTSIIGAFTGVMILLAQCPAPGHVPSPPPVTVAVFVAGEPVPFAIATGTLITGAFPPGSNTALVVQLTFVAVLALQSQPEPLGVAVAVIPAGSASTTVIVPAVLVVPVLLTSSEYVPVPPTANALGVALLAIVNCTAPPFVFVAVALLRHGAVAHVLEGSGELTVAVFAIDPVALNATVALTVYVTDPPLGRSTLSPILPLPLAVHVPPPAPTHVHVTPVSVAGSVSLTAAPVTALGPALLTTIV